MATLPGFGITVPDYNPGTTFDGTNWSGIDSTATNPLWQQWAADSGLAPAVDPAVTTTTTTTARDPYQDYLDELARQKAAADLARRTNAFDEMYAVLKQFGIDMDGSGLGATVRGWVFEDKSDDFIMMSIRTTKAYNDRFTGMADLIKKGQAMSEAEYIAQERSYRNVMTQWQLPTNFYDDYSDYGRFIANGVSVKELDDRIRSAKTFLDENAPSTYKDALASMYGVNEGSMLAYVLDGDKAQSLIVQQVKAAAFAGAGTLAGFGLDTAEAEKYGATLGANFDTFGIDQRMTLEATLSQMGIQAANDVRLGSIDKEDVTMEDTLDAELLADGKKKLASQRRGLREGARFSGSSGVTTGSLSRNSGA